jgi:hypothetical protein
MRTLKALGDFLNKLDISRDSGYYIKLTGQFCGGIYERER